MKKIIFAILGLTVLLVGCSLDETTGITDGPEPLNTLCINEFMSHNDLACPGPNNEFPDWIELYNGSNETIDVGGMYLSDDPGNLTMSMIGDDVPGLTTLAPGEYLVLICNGTPELGPLQLDFKLSDNEDFVLVDTDGSTIIDQHNTVVIPDDQTEGRVPDGTDHWEILTVPTPGVGNAETPEPVINLLINEFLASNEFTNTDENGDADDWIEIYNAGTIAVDIGGMWVTDDLTNLATSQIPTTAPDSTTIQPGGYLILWADKEPEQGVLHLDDVKLSGDGEQIGLTAADGVTVLDSLTYGPQTTDISYGRYPDGSNDWELMAAPTPGESNTQSAPEMNIVMNEFMSHNDLAWPGPNEEYPDWIELYNSGNVAVDIAGWSLTDDLEDLTQSIIPDTDPELTTIQPGEYLVLICNSTPELGVLQLGFKLGDDEDFALVAPDGVTIVDQHNTGALADDVSEGRVPDGSDNWEILDPSTPGGPN